MTNEEKKNYGYMLSKIVDELNELVEQCHVGISLMVLYDANGNYTHGAHHLHYNDDDRMVSLRDDDSLTEAFFIERDDTVRKEKEKDGENNTEK